MEAEITKEDLDHVHGRIDKVEQFLEHVLQRVEQALGLAQPAAAAAAAVVQLVAPGSSAAAGTASVARVLETIADAVPCPHHPDAPQTANGCTADGCTFSPAQ